LARTNANHTLSWFLVFGLLFHHTASQHIQVVRSTEGLGLLVCYVVTQVAFQLHQDSGTHTSRAFWFLVCCAATQLALELHQERIQVVRSNKVVRRIPTESNGTPAMDLGHMIQVVVLKCCMCLLVVPLPVDLRIGMIILMIIIIIIIVSLFLFWSS